MKQYFLVLTIIHHIYFISQDKNYNYGKREVVSGQTFLCFGHCSLYNKLESVCFMPFKIVYELLHYIFALFTLFDHTLEGFDLRYCPNLYDNLIPMYTPTGKHINH